MARFPIEKAHQAANVRLVRGEDVAHVVALVAEVLEEFGFVFGKGAATDADLLRLPASYTTAGGAFWVAVVGHDLIGTCGVFPVASDTYELRKMYLRGAARGLGLGKRLLDEAVQWTRARGGRRLVLDTAEQMKRAIAFYEAHGLCATMLKSGVRGAREGTCGISFETFPHTRTARCYKRCVQKEWLGIPLWLVFGILGAWMATSKGRGGCFWFLVCALLGPIGLVVAAILPKTGRS
jgi:GNAT superfamily N-acetyltransferase